MSDAFLSLLCVIAMAVLTITQIQWTPGNIPKVTNGRIAYGYHVVGTDHCAGGAANGTKSSLEGCDDNNSTNGDGCSNKCMVESGWTCNSASPSVCATVCGDSLIKGSEGCDDGDTDSGDGCSSSCAVESGWSCSGTPSSCSAAICGDGIKIGNEGCDDGNTTNSDGCDNSCAVESGYTCTGQGSSSCTTTCGDSLKKGSEKCDDGNTTNGDGCNNSCAVESGYTCTGEPSTCTNKGIGGGGSGGGLPETPIVPRGPPPPCGNAIREPEKCEECDNGRANGTSACTQKCTVLYCGDGAIATHLKEECEGRIEEEREEDPVTKITVSRFWFVTTSCGTSCTLPKWTQKGNIWEYTTGTGCKRDLSLPPCKGQPTERRVQVRPPFSCSLYSSSTASSSVSVPPSRPKHCGDGLLQTKEGEECDRILYDKVMVQSIGKTLYSCSPDCQISYCGDGNITPYSPLNEECDPEHTTYRSLLCAPNDQTLGCTQECRSTRLSRCIEPPPQEEIPVTNIQGPSPEEEDVIEEQEEDLEEVLEEEPGVLPPEMPTPPSLPTVSTIPTIPPTPSACGNGITEMEEECDDGNVTETDLCSNQCHIARCGDGIVQEWEACDPPCPTSCKREELHAAAEESPAGRRGTSTILVLVLASFSALTQSTWKRWIRRAMNVPQN